MKNFTAKVLSLFFAFLLWWYVKEASTIERYSSLPLKVINLPENMVILNEYDRFVAVKISGPAEIVSGIDLSGAYAYVDLKNAKEGKRAYPIKFHHRPLPSDVEIIPDKTGVVFDLDYLVSKDVEVNLRTSGRLKLGLQLAGVEYSPRFVTIRGPKRYIKGVHSIETYPIDLGEIMSDTYRMVLLKLPHWVDWVSRKFVDVKIRVRAVKGERWFVGVPVSVEGLEKELELQEINPDRVSVRVSGLRYIVDRVRVRDVKAYIDMSIIVKEGTYRLPVRVSLPSGVRAVEIIPKFVEVTVEE